MLINEEPKKILEDFLTDYDKVQPINILKAREIIKDAIKKHSKHKDDYSYIKGLEDRWYMSLDLGNPYYFLYDEEYYFTDVFSCWSVYSRKYLRSIQKLNLEGITSVLDLGCGIGYTTASLKEMFPTAEVFGTNLAGTKQYSFCEKLGEKFNFKVIPDTSTLKQVDLVFASEYFEHIEYPLEHLDEVIALQPKYIIVANAFNTRALGHFEKYKYAGTIIGQEKMSKVFNARLVASGYKKVKTGFWNNRPTVWKI
jgi:SAM-dependent methyltransferase